MAGLSQKLGIHLLTILAVVLSIIFTPVLIVLVVVPVLLFRSLVILLHKTKSQQQRDGDSSSFSRTRILTPLSSYFAADDKESPLSTNLIHIGIEGHVPLAALRESLIENVLKKREGVTGELVYPELQQYVTRYCGFSFWENDSSFNVDNHIREVRFPGKEVITEEDYVPFMKRLVGAPFEEGRSPWEIIVMHNCKEVGARDESPITLVTFRIHHSLSGGYSTMNFILDVGNVSGTRAVAAFPRVPAWKQLLWYALYLFRAPYEALHSVLTAFLAPNGLRGLSSGNNKGGMLIGRKLNHETSVAVSSPIPVQSIKEIKNGLESSFSSVISAAIAGGIRSFMIERKVPIPDSIHVMTPWPVKDIPAKLGNFLTSVILEYPIGLESPLKRVQAIESNFVSMKYSTVPRTFYLFMEVMGRMFNFMLKPAHSNAIASIIMSNIAGPNEQLYFLDRNICTMTFVSGFICNNIGLGFTVLSYNGNLRIICGGDTAFLPTDDEARKLLSSIINEFQVLRDECV